MNILVELDGPILDVRAAHYAAYHEAAGAVGWSRVNEAIYWRLVRTKGRQADILPGARGVKIEQYYQLFSAQFESDANLAKLAPHDGLAATLGVIAGGGRVSGVTLGANVKAREAVLDRAGVLQHFSDLTGLSDDPRVRPSELRSLCDGDRRTIVVASGEELLRSACAAELFSVGVSTGACSKPRLHRAGAAVVYGSLEALSDSLRSGGADLIAAGLLPPSHHA